MPRPRADRPDQEPTKYRFAGQTLMRIGALHTLSLFGLLILLGTLVDIAQDGVFNAVGLYPDRQAALWSLIMGVSLMLMGYLARWPQHCTGTLPAALGWTLLAIAAVGVVLLPVSGFWLIILAAVFALAASQHTGIRSDPRS
jgi:hypothetical protein